jgi:hypothetical protein
MSRYNDINQLLKEIGTSARSAGDPWTLSRSNRGTVKRSAFSPAVVADLGAPAQDLTSDIKSSEAIAHANAVSTSPASTSGTGGSSTGSSILGGLLNFFPFASGIAKLIGFGGSSSPPVLTPYQRPPSISFEGAMANPTSGVTSLSYGADGLPRTATTAQTGANATHVATTSAFTQALTDQSPVATAGSTPTNVAGQLDSLAQSNLSGSSDNTSIANPLASLPSTLSLAQAPSPDVSNNSADIAGQLGMLANSSFDTEPSAINPSLNASLSSQGSIQNSATSSLSSTSANPGGVDSAGSGASSSTSQGHSILVQVQAMDSQSFMDHSQQIAQAVRQAMLNSNSLNDVIQDL